MSLVSFARANLLCLLLVSASLVHAAGAVGLSVVVLACSTAISAEIQYAKTMHDKIPLYGTQADSPRATFDPASSDETVIIEAGQTVELQAGGEIALDVLVRGQGAVLRLLPGSILWARTVTAVDGGKIDGRDCQMVTRNLPIDTGTKDAPGIDPSQYGHGLLVINGELQLHSDHWRQSYCRAALESQAGDVQIVLSSGLHGWQVGDTLIVPDTRQPTTGADLSAQTERVQIADIQGTRVTLSSPLAFSHLGWHRSDGSVGLMFDVANVTQPIVIRSENPNGVRGHVFITAASHQDVEGVALVDMGRTTSAPLHSTLRDDQGNIAQIGTNQIGRYAWHHHHLLGRRNNGLPYQFRFQHCSVDGSPKWGVAIHGSHFGLVDDCAAYNCAGSGLVTEDPHVYGNKITNNIVIAKHVGSGQRITDRSGRNLAGGDHWHDRGGLGLASAMNEITGNRLYCCKESIGMAGFGTSQLYKPTERGVCPTCSTANRVTLASHMGYVAGEPKRYPFLFDTSGNVAWSGWRGIETWTADCYVGREKMFPGLTLVHCRNSTDLEDQEETALYGWRSLGDLSKAVAPTGNGTDATYALNFKPAYRFGITAIECEFRGHDAAYELIDDGAYTRFQQCQFECPVINYLPLGRKVNVGGAWDGEWTDCTFDGNTVFADGQYPKYDLKLWLTMDRPDRMSLKPTRYFIRPWKDGRDYQVYHYEQLPTFAKPPLVDPTKAYGDWPAGLNTHQQLIERGTPIFGDVVPATAVQWGKFWADNQTPCEREVELLRQELEEARQ